MVAVEKDGEEVEEERQSTVNLERHQRHRLKMRDVISLSEGIATFTIVSIKHLESL